MNDTYEKDLAMESMVSDELSEDDLEQVSGGSGSGYLSNLFGSAPEPSLQIITPMQSIKPANGLMKFTASTG
ncbi:MAG: hypothetical protein IJT94_07395 [Oscillibacter sp.]|nr:hypothetical protein [Oscillibacter sp.]